MNKFRIVYVLAYFILFATIMAAIAWYALRHGMFR
jgi:hypothetical protein